MRMIKVYTGFFHIKLLNGRPKNFCTQLQFEFPLFKLYRMLVEFKSFVNKINMHAASLLMSSLLEIVIWIAVTLS